MTLSFISAPSIESRAADRIIVAATGVAFLATLAIGITFEQFALALTAGAGLCAAGLAAWRSAPGTLFSRLALTAVLMAFVALHVQLGRGRTEFHFGVFVTLGLVLVYIDWRPIAFGAALIAVHHIVFDRMHAAGIGVYCTAAPSLPTVVLHAGYVVVQAGTELFMAVMMKAIADEARRTSAALGATLEKVQGTVASTRQGATCIEAAAVDIAQGNTDLSRRTGETASRLQDATGSLELLTDSVRSGAESAAAANQLAVTTAGVAEHGGQLVREVVAKMDDISSSSKRIGDIIGVIDGIAFQTNVLALNAAVEAARAGEQGRGFAIVASEVRSLSQRSSAAAREIKALIEASCADVASGGRLVHEAGAKIGEIVTGVGSVAQLVDAICKTTVQQSENIVAVSRTVTDIGRMTRENTALVEQSAQAAESLRVQAARLLET